MELRHTQPGSPVQNAYIKSFNSRFRDECLSQQWFANLGHMRSILENWREDYNHHQPHSALGYLPRQSSPRIVTCEQATMRISSHQL